MLMKLSGQIQLGEEIMYSMFTVVFSVQYCHFFQIFLCLLLLFTVIVTCTEYSILRLSVVC